MRRLGIGRRHHPSCRNDCTAFADIDGDLTVGGDLTLHGVVSGKIRCGGEIVYQ
ncbi:MAG: hypothetical protein IJ493_00425 [Clostridia bacterium]|nr:hypothetical protein [Clostridia bacterium]